MKYNLAYITTALLLSTLISASSCKKDNSPATEEQLPPETQTGANTFGCKVDGKIYTASGKASFLGSQTVSYAFYSDTSLSISATNSNTKFYLSIAVKYNGSVGLHFTTSYPNEGLFIDNSNGTIPGNYNSYSTDSLLKGRINIKYFNGNISPLQVGSIVAGVFEMEAKNANGKVIKITEGRFDIGR